MAVELMMLGLMSTGAALGCGTDDDGALNTAGCEDDTPPPPPACNGTDLVYEAAMQLHAETGCGDAPVLAVPPALPGDASDDCTPVSWTPPVDQPEVCAPAPVTPPAEVCAPVTWTPPGADDACDPVPAPCDDLDQWWDSCDDTPDISDPLPPVPPVVGDPPVVSDPPPSSGGDDDADGSDGPALKPWQSGGKWAKDITPAVPTPVADTPDADTPSPQGEDTDTDNPSGDAPMAGDDSLDGAGASDEDDGTDGPDSLGGASGSDDSMTGGESADDSLTGGQDGNEDEGSEAGGQGGGLPASPGQPDTPASPPTTGGGSQAGDNSVETDTDDPTDSSVPVERLTGTPDIYLGTPGADNVQGLQGNDTLIGGGGADTLGGGAGDDTIISEGAGGRLSGHDGDDYIQARKTGFGQYHIYAGAGDDTIEMFGDNEDGWGHQGFHARGGSGADEFQFNDTERANAPLVARIEDFDPTVDVLMVDDEIVDLTDPPEGMRVVIYLEQQWLVIENTIMIGLQAVRDPAPDGVPTMPGNTEELHFPEVPVDLASLPGVSYAPA